MEVLLVLRNGFLPDARYSPPYSTKTVELLLKKGDTAVPTGVLEKLGEDLFFFPVDIT